MGTLELLDLINRRTHCRIDFTQPEQGTLNLNQWGEINRLQPVTPGRQKFTVTLDQDALEILASLVTLKP